MIPLLRAMLLLLCCGCASAPPISSWEPAEAGDYEDVLAAWTRHGERYENFEGRLFATATLFSPAFTARYGEFEGRRRGLEGDELQRFIDTKVERTAQETRLFLSLHTVDLLWNQLEREGGVFEATLFVDDAPLQPVKVERIMLQESSFIPLLFPYFTPLCRGYWVTFPAVSPNRTLRFRISGAPASLTLNWRIPS